MPLPKLPKLFTRTATLTIMIIQLCASSPVVTMQIPALLLYETVANMQDRFITQCK